MDHFKNVYDIKLKPRMLRGLIEEHFPEETQPTRIRYELSKIAFLIRTHKLLSESANDSMEKKLVDSWKSAVDEWVVRVSSLVSSNMPDKCWTGICLLGLTCQECNYDRFLASYSVWFNKLYLHIQQSSESQFVKVASCHSISDLLTRLEKLPNGKKDGSSLAGKLIQPLLKLLNEDSSEAVWAEATIASKLLSGKCSENMMKKLVYCLALLPKAKGDEESWCLMMQKILLLINSNLNDRFQGLEEENKVTEAVRALVPPGKDPPPPLGDHMLLGEAVDDAAKRSERLTTSSISMLIFCCSTMLTSSYPVRVNVPIRPLLALVDRMLMVDGSVPHSLSPFMTVMQQQSACVELPVLHLYSLELLAAIIEGMHSQLLPHGAFILRLVKQFFKRCALPELRRKLYSITKLLLLFMGAGVALPLAEVVVDNACADLNPVADENGCTTSSPTLKAASLVPMQSRRKRKHGATLGSSEGQLEITGLGMGVSKNHPASPISLKIAALEALETLLTVAGDLGSASWRPTVDLLLITIATDYCQEGWGNEESHSTALPDDPIISLADLQLSALRALLASLLSSARMRPPHFGRALELFGKGKQQAGRVLAGFCASALLALEVLIHPRFLPLERFPCRILENIHSGGQKQSTSGMHGTGQRASDSFDDDLYETWFGDGHPTEIPVHGPGENVAGSPGTKVSERNNEEQAGVGLRNNEDEAMVESQQFQELPYSKGVIDSTVAGDLKLPERETEAERETEVAVPEGGLDGKSHETASSKDFIAGKGDGFAKVGGNAPTASYAEKGKKPIWDLDDDSSMDSFPDIVDVDPDSDTEGDESG
ncbi:RIX1 domain-containing protein [Citrus sinensis]|uniref:RIX1 domain-containing protein n=1 Tax=Citrus sinensis TaxID=2711 RepID=A0ACB8IJ40_CITSI|nr:RIX1 domain-containing protein [Citrus sinensis]